MGGLLTLGSWVRQFPEIDTVNNPGNTHISTIQGISVASYNVGCFVGAVITIFIGDILGRRKMIFLGSSIMIVGAVLQASAFSLAHLIVGRIITGFGNGMNTSTVPTWASETSKSHVSLLTLTLLAFCGHLSDWTFRNEARWLWSKEP